MKLYYTFVSQLKILYDHYFFIFYCNDFVFYFPHYSYYIDHLEAIVLSIFIVITISFQFLYMAMESSVRLQNGSLLKFFHCYADIWRKLVSFFRVSLMYSLTVGRHQIRGNTQIIINIVRSCHVYYRCSSIYLHGKD